MEPVHFIPTYIQSGCTQLDLGGLLGECVSAQGVIMVTWSRQGLLFSLFYDNIKMNPSRLYPAWQSVCNQQYFNDN